MLKHAASRPIDDSGHRLGLFSFLFFILDFLQDVGSIFSCKA